MSKKFYVIYSSISMIKFNVYFLVNCQIIIRMFLWIQTKHDNSCNVIFVNNMVINQFMILGNVNISKYIPTVSLTMNEKISALIKTRHFFHYIIFFLEGIKEFFNIWQSEIWKKNHKNYLRIAIRKLSIFLNFFNGCISMFYLCCWINHLRCCSFGSMVVDINLESDIGFCNGISIFHKNRINGNKSTRYLILRWRI